MLFSLTVISNFNCRLFCWIGSIMCERLQQKDLRGCYGHEGLRGCLVFTVVYGVPNCGVGYFLDVVQIMVGVL